LETIRSRAGAVDQQHPAVAAISDEQVAGSRRRRRENGEMPLRRRDRGSCRNVLAVMSCDADPCNRHEADDDEPRASPSLPARELLFTPSAFSAGIGSTHGSQMKTA
jgi:hypothetical protein